MSQLIDLRSDTVTHPTPEMRRAMADAAVGDDVFEDDPTVIKLEERAAGITGKEAGLFVASGTMGNLVSHMVHVRRGGEIITGAGTHLAIDEAAGHAAISGASIASVPVDRSGQMDLAAIGDTFRDTTDIHLPLTSLVVLENTHAESMGQPLDALYTSEVAAIAHAHDVPLHIDGARLFNAVVALGTTAAALLAHADSATFCLSKGLACPIGSVVVGSADFIRSARRARKLVGGGMRQVGILAAAGCVALQEGSAGTIERLAEDHENARALADGLVDLHGIHDLDPERVVTDFVLFRVRPSSGQSEVTTRAALLEDLASRGVLLVAYPHGFVRAVTHYGIGRDDVARTVAAVRDSLAAIGVAPGAV